MNKELHQIANILSNRHPPKILPTIYPSADLPSIFIKHFTNKVEKHRANIASEHVTSTLVTGTTAATFSSFEKVSQLTVKECILNSAPKSCELRELAYTSLVRSILEYSSTVWDPFYQKDIDRLERVQRRAARFVLNDYKPLSSVTSMVSQLGWKPLAERRREHRLSLLYKIINGLVAIPAVYTHLHFNTRNIRISHSKSLKLPICSTDTFKHSFFPATIRDWNLLPDDIVNCKKLSPFKEAICKSRD